MKDNLMYNSSPFDLLTSLLGPLPKVEGGLAFEDSGQDDANFYWRLEVPGFEPSEVLVEVKDRVLTFSGKKETATEYSAGKAWKHEMRSFKNAVTLPQNADSDRISASQKNGVLTLTLPKLQSDPHNVESRRVEVKQLP